MPSGRAFQHQTDGSRPSTSVSAADTVRLDPHDHLRFDAAPGASSMVAMSDEEDPDYDDHELDGPASPPRSIENLAPPGLREISSLAAWTVSSAKPDFGVAALRSSRPDQFWQSDGPQPHTLSLHFFKLVSIVSMRVYMDFDTDESYTPTKIQFWAGMGIHDLHEFSTMELEQPRGWIDVDFSRVGPMPPTLQDERNPDAPEVIDWAARPVLKAFLVQVRILENHQNGKDTHLRAFQVFARDDSVRLPVKRPKRVSTDDRKTTKMATGRAITPAWLQEPTIR